MARVLLINPSYSRNYGSAKAGLTNPVFPTLGLATVAGAALARGHDVRILDLSNCPYDWRQVQAAIESWGAEVVGITATTPLMNQLRDLSILCKDISRDIVVVGGGPHVSALPHESLQESALDLVVAGEGDVTFADVCDGLTPSSIPGLYYRDDTGAIQYSGERPLVADLDGLPMPAWHLYHAPDYRRRVSRLLARRPPVTMAEFSRGCIYRCDFCASKMTMGLGYRRKSPDRCAEEVRVMARLGWREFMLADDIFTTDREWAMQVSHSIGAAGTGMAWSCTNGIRVESAHDGLFRAMRAAGCYRVSFGLETGSDAVLQSFGKGGRATVAQGRRAVDIAQRAGLETSGYFLLGVSEDTEATMRETIDYARSLPLDFLKFGVTVAFPGTTMFNELVAAGLIRSYDWDRYQIYSDDALFVHRHLAADIVPRYMALAYRRAIGTNLPFLGRRIAHGLRTGQLFWDLWYGLQFSMLPATSGAVETGYYAKARWPVRDYGAAPPTAITYPQALASR